jgi:hypothetical protein
MSKPTKEELHELYDYIDGSLYHKKRKQRIQPGQKAGTIDHYGYVAIHLNHKKYKEHHLVWAYHYDMYPGMLDHIDGNKTNNQIHNLRIATPSQNQMNRKINKNNKTGVKGLYFRNNRWLAIIKFNKNRVGKSFKDKEEAIQFIHTTRSKLHGDFARFQ